jgi:hypothetical protein
VNIGSGTSVWSSIWSRRSGGFRGYPPSRRLIDALESGGPVSVEGRELEGRGIPKVSLRRRQWFDRFSVSPDDSVVPTESPED